jgi:hypothetical protein
MTILVGDIETNGFEPSIIWVVGVMDAETNEYTSYVGTDQVCEGLARLADADIVIGHNFKGYDAKYITKLTDGLIEFDQSRIVDTCELSRILFPHLVNHKLETWGEILGFPKIKYTEGFTRFHPKMVPYCEQDVRLNKALYDFLLREMEGQAA